MAERRVRRLAETGRARLSDATSTDMSAVNQRVRRRAATSGVVVRSRILAVAAAAAALVVVQPGPAGAAGDPSTTETFTVTSGALTLTVPASANLGSGAPGTVISAPIGPCTVTDDRALLSASWTVTAAETDFVNGTATIPATNATYTVGSVTTTGTITVTPTNVTLSNTAQTVLTGTAGVGDNTASWDPTISVNVPAGAVGGTYTGTLTQSVA
ncbi:hypothetical protein ACIGXI_10205 [Kitasatospora aureofaciens]|uniref:hypothetical protein n=1 Tax=Kitasatospora aureofaciens TaxID=1894 RepID=UPI0037C71CDE